jgi:transcription elongation factor GreA
MSRDGYNRIKAELDHLQHHQMPQIAARIAAAREEGDLSENAEYHGALESQGMLQAKINLLRDKLARAAIVDPSKIRRDEVAFGATVVVKDLQYDDEEQYTLVGPGEEDYDTGKILLTSPVGQGLLGKKVGDHVNIDVPKGTLKYQILEIRYEQ